jgi:ubiquinone/menaquinone biosynthesis C-methylase UbiE
MATTLARLAYGAAQSARVSWYFGQKWLAARRSERTPAPAERRARMPDTARVLKDLGALLARDLANIEAGCYELPVDLLPNPLEELRLSRRFFADLKSVEERRRGRRNSEVLGAAPPGRYPRYYLQNFHYQTDGWLSDASAALYDHQVEVLFGGAADAMRRQALVPLHHEMQRRRVRETRLLDIACGTGRFLREIKNNYPRLAVTGLDLSPNYLGAARRNLADWSRVEFVESAAEAMTLPDESVDIATCVYLFHELPAKLRRRVAAETARVLTPGGLMILVDSLQLGDEPDYDALLEHFPAALHEPYFADYIREDLPAMFAAAGLEHAETTLAYFSKVASFRKPARPSRQRRPAPRRQVTPPSSATAEIAAKARR